MERLKGRLGPRRCHHGQNFQIVITRQPCPRNPHTSSENVTNNALLCSLRTHTSSFLVTCELLLLKKRLEHLRLGLTDCWSTNAVLWANMEDAPRIVELKFLTRILTWESSVSGARLLSNTLEIPSGFFIGGQGSNHVYFTWLIVNSDIGQKITYNMQMHLVRTKSNSQNGLWVDQSMLRVILRDPLALYIPADTRSDMDCWKGWMHYIVTGLVCMHLVGLMSRLLNRESRAE